MQAGHIIQIANHSVESAERLVKQSAGKLSVQWIAKQIEEERKHYL
jgi:hypothetical protein